MDALVNAPVCCWFDWMCCVEQFSSSSPVPDGEEPGTGGPDRSRPAAERGSESANGQLSDAHSVRPPPTTHHPPSCSAPCWSALKLSGPTVPPAGHRRHYSCLSLVPRQLSKEEQDLRVALERQTAINQNLSQEKEQLIFKLRHRNSYPSIHLPTMVQELAPR